jgi:hypothetical protein
MAARKKNIRREPELTLQSEIVESIKKILKRDVMLTAFPSGGGGRIRGGKLKRAGLVAGWPDLQLIRKGKYYGLEIKTPVGVLSPVQKKIHSELTQNGCKVAIARSAEDAKEILIDWGLVRC